jgi:hypothetical protein
LIYRGACFCTTLLLLLLLLLSVRGSTPRSRASILLTWWRGFAILALFTRFPTLRFSPSLLVVNIRFRSFVSSQRIHIGSAICTLSRISAISVWFRVNGWFFLAVTLLGDSSRIQLSFLTRCLALFDWRRNLIFKGFGSIPSRSAVSSVEVVWLARRWIHVFAPTRRKRLLFF